MVAAMIEEAARSVILGRPWRYTALDTTRARTEQQVAYQHRLNSIDAHIKVSAASFSLMQRLIDGPGGDRILGSLYEAAEQPWAKTERVPLAIEKVLLARDRSVSLALVAIHGEFEAAARRMVADILEFWLDEIPKETAVAEVPSPRTSPIEKRGWASPVAASLRSYSAGEEFLTRCRNLVFHTEDRFDHELVPIYDYFRRVRNRVVHQDGIVNSGLAEFSVSAEVKASQASLDKSVKRATPPVPTQDDGQLVSLEPKHLVLYKLVCFRLFDALAGIFKPQLDHDGYIRMASYYSLIAPHHPYREKNHKHVHVPVRKFLTGRYRIRNVSAEFLIEQCRRLGIWESLVASFNSMYPYKL